MLNKKIALLSAAAIAMVSTGANAATVNADARATILDPVELEQTAVLDFGVIAPGAGGNVTLPTNSNVRSCAAGVTCAGTAQRGALQVRGASGYNVRIVVAGSTTLTTTGGATMPLTLTTDAPATLLANGNWQPFNVGGTLSVAAAQTAGTYTGQYNVTADYQ